MQLQESNEVFVLGVFSSADSKGYKTFLSVASDDESSVYAVTLDATVKKQLAVEAGRDSLICLWCERSLQPENNARVILRYFLFFVLFSIYCLLILIIIFYVVNVDIFLFSPTI
jgi:hypothetical protein